MKTLKQWWTERKAQVRKAELENIKNDFKVFEKNGKIYLTHQGYAFMVMPDKETAENIASKLNAARNVAIEFEEE